MSVNKSLNSLKILSLLHELDNRLHEQCRIIICGGASAIVAHGLQRFTGDIDIFEPIPKIKDFYVQIKAIGEEHGLDSVWLNESAKGYSDCLSPGYKNRLISISSNFRRLSVYAISKADLITMKICAWRESDKGDIESLNITAEDLAVIDENLRFLQKHRPDLADKAMHVLEELGIKKITPLAAEKISTLAELIQFHTEIKKTDASIDEIRNWKKQIAEGLKPFQIARAITEEHTNEI